MDFIGIDLGGTRIKIALVNSGLVSNVHVINVIPETGLATHLKLIDEVIDELLKEQGSILKGIAMAFPGLVDSKQKKVLSTNAKYDDAPGMDLESYYKEKWQVPFFIDNDARMATVGEWRYGAGRGSDDMVMVTLGTGVGTGVIMEGKPLRGRHFQAGCLGGHFIVNYQGNFCTCGNIGCVEAEAATWNLDQQLRQQKTFPESELAGLEKIDFEVLFNMARQGDKLACDFRDRCMQVWAAGVINLIHAYDPEIVILGGGVLKSSEEIVTHIQGEVKQKAWTPWGEVKIELSELKDKAAILGAVFCLEKDQIYATGNHRHLNSLL